MVNLSKVQFQCSGEAVEYEFWKLLDSDSILLSRLGAISKHDTDRYAGLLRKFTYSVARDQKVFL